MYQKKTYHNHRIPGNSKEDYQILFQSQSITPDRHYMADQLKIHFDYLNSHGISSYPNFVQLFHDYGFKSNDQFDFITSFTIFLKITNDIEIFLLKNREMKKTNLSEKNLLLNRLACQFPKELLEYLKFYINEKFQQMLNRDVLFKDFQAMIDQLSSQKEKNLISVLESHDDQLSNPFEDDEYDIFFEGSTLLTEL